MGIKVFGLAGKSGHGKDFCADIITDIAWRDFGQIVIKWSLADLLKARVYGEADGRYSLNDVFVNKPPEIRGLLQQVGTERGRDVFGEDLWTRQVEAILYLLEKKAPFIKGVVIADCRFMNEVEFCRMNGRVVQDMIPSLRRKAVKIVDAANAYRVTPLTTDERDERVMDITSVLLDDAEVKSPGRCAYIMSNRPTLTGEFALHPSETALDDVNKDEEFDYILTNNDNTTEEDLREQLRPIVKEWLDLA